VQIPDGSKASIPNKSRFIYAEDTLRARGIIRKGVSLIKTVDFNKIRRDKATREYKKKQEEEMKRIEELKLPESQESSTGGSKSVLPKLSP